MEKVITSITSTSYKQIPQEAIGNPKKFRKPFVNLISPRKTFLAEVRDDKIAIKRSLKEVRNGNIEIRLINT